MRALHVIGVDLELRSRVGLGLSGQQQAVITLLRLRLLCARLYDNTSTEDRARTVIENTPVPFVTGRLRLVVFDTRVVVHMLLMVRQGQAVEGAFRTTTVEVDLQFVAYQPAAQCDTVCSQMAVAVLLYVQATDVRGCCAFLFQLVML